MKKKDLTYRKMGRLLVKTLTPAPERSWYCLCECGTECIVKQRYLLAGTTKSCGCLQKERQLAAVKAHNAKQRGGGRGSDA